ncbi:MAG: peptidase [Clostridia bacterium]|nr:peptidase [Clostridia bacterium]
MKFIKRISLVLFLSLLFVVIYFSYYTLFLSGENFSQIAVNTAVEDLTEDDDFYDPESAKLFKSALKNAVKQDSNEIISGLEPRLNIVTHSNTRNPISYSLYIKSMTSREGYLYNETKKQLYKLSANDFSSLLLINDFNGIYINKEPPVFTLSLQETEAGAFTSIQSNIKTSNWNYALADGSFVNNSINNNIDNNFTLLTNNEPLSLIMPIRPDLVTVKLYDENNLIYEGITNNGEIYRAPHDGKMTYEITAVWNASGTKEYYGEVTYYFNIENDLPTEIVTSGDKVAQGEVLRILVRNINEGEAVKLTCEQLGYEAMLFDVDKGKSALLPIDCATVPGIYTLKAEKGTEQTEIKFEVTETDFEKGTLSIETTIESSGLKQQKKYLTPLKSLISEQLYMTGAFIAPVEGKITTSFGLMRYTNDNPTPSRHNGLDIADKNKPDILAAQAGKVVLAMKMEITGNTVVIDHGMNVLSYYYHMDDINVEEGDIVTQGQKVGVMGSTGYATGDHLHFTVMVNGTAISPIYMYNTNFTKIYNN